MFTIELKTSDPKLKLVRPDITRDSSISIEWLRGKQGRQTLALMGVPEKDNKESTLKDEINRVKDFIEKPNQLNWMINYDGTIIGSIWVDTVENHGLDAPSIHMMIGDPAYRKKGIGTLVTKSVLDYLKAEGYSIIYSRHLVDNKGSANLTSALGFIKSGDPYTDEDGLVWQNVKKNFSI